MSVDRKPSVEERLDEVREVEMSSAGYELDRLPLEDVDAHAHVIRERRLLVETDDPAAVQAGDAEVDLNVATMDRDGRRGAAGLMGREKLAEVETRQQIAVHDEKARR